jgi:8-oxo-dGTP pyrophosphatase MutT (NUDIX family)
MARSPDRGTVHHEACAVPFRLREQRIEFCLVSAERSSRWEFPHTLIAENETPDQAARRCVMEQAGLPSHAEKQEQLDDFKTTQNERRVRFTAYLLEVDSAGSTKSQHRVRWCFAEEARARIRRKPMRRLIDLAMRRQTDL